VSHADN
jgi:glycine hydroxymethyltransferase